MEKEIIYFQTKHFNEVKSTDDWVSIEWFASTKDIDRYQDIVKPSAFVDAIKGFKKNPIMLLQHNHEKVIGKFSDFEVTSKGLKVKWIVTNDVDNVKQNIQDWLLKGFSIWFIAKNWGYKEKDWVEIREITELELLEISVVSVPANPHTLFQAVKKFFNNLNKNNMDIKEIKEEILDEEQVETSVEEVKETEEAKDQEEASEDKEEEWVEEKAEETEEVSEEVKEEEKVEEEEKEAKVEAWEETHELHNEENSDESENSAEKSEEIEEAKEEPKVEAADEKAEETEEESTEVEKSWEAEIDLKALVEDLIAVVEKQSAKAEEQSAEIKELKWALATVWLRKGIATLWKTKSEQRTSNDAWLGAFKSAKANS